MYAKIAELVARIEVLEQQLAATRPTPTLHEQLAEVEAAIRREVRDARNDTFLAASGYVSAAVLWEAALDVGPTTTAHKLAIATDQAFELSSLQLSSDDPMGTRLYGVAIGDQLLLHANSDAPGFGLDALPGLQGQWRGACVVGPTVVALYVRTTNACRIGARIRGSLDIDVPQWRSTGPDGRGEYGSCAGCHMSIGGREPWRRAVDGRLYHLRADGVCNPGRGPRPTFPPPRA